MANADISLLFGVLGEGSLGGESGSLIQSQLGEIIKSLNTKPFKIKVGLDTENGGQKSWGSQLQTKIDNLSNSNKFSIKVSNIALGAGAVTDFKNQLNAVINTLNLDKGTSITLTAEGIGEIKKEMQKAGDEATEAARKVTGFKEAVAGAVLKEREEAIAQNTANQAAEQAAKKEAEYRSQLDRVNNVLIQAKKNLESWTAARNGKSSGSYSTIEREVQNLEDLKSELLNSGEAVDNFDERFGSAKSNIRNVSESIRDAGENTKTLAERAGTLAGKFSSWLTISQIIMQVYRALKQMVATVIEVDTAMTELRKVTNETEVTYSKFIDTAIRRSKELGATVSDTITASADFARLGFSLDEASALADAAIVYKNVGDGITDITTASESIISTMKAFGIAAEDAMFIVDKFNEVGNNFAISSKGVGDALLRSASALATGNNTLDESIALITAANSVVQDADVVGTTLKTVSMYLRAAKTEAEEAGESTEGMANSVSELRAELLALTGEKVDIQIDEDTFKSTTQIIRELANVWDDLTDISRANILEMIGGKRNANVVSSLIENFETAEEVITKAANATGSALAENEKYLESIRGAISQFQATFEELSITLIDGEMVEGIVDIGTGLLNLLNVVAKVINVLGGLKTVLLSVASAFLVAKGGIIAFTVVEKAIAIFKSLRRGITMVIDIIPNAITAWKAYAAGIVSANTAIQASIPVIGLVIAAITAVIGAFSLFSGKAEEARQEALDLGDAAKEEAKSIIELKNSYEAAYESYQNNIGSKEDLESATSDLLKALGLEQAEVDALNKKYGDLNSTINAVTTSTLKNKLMELTSGYQAAVETLMKETKNGFITFWSILGYDTGDEIDFSDYLVERGLQDGGSYRAGSGNIYLPNDSLDDVIGSYEKLLAIREALNEGISDGRWTREELAESDIYIKVTDRLTDMKEEYESVLDYINQINSISAQLMFDQITISDLPKTAEEFEELKESMIASALTSGEFVGTQEQIRDSITNTLAKMPEMAQFVNNYSESLGNVGGSVDEINKNAQAIGKFKNILGTLKEAADEYNSSGYVSTELYQKVIALNKDYAGLFSFANGKIELTSETLDKFVGELVQEYGAMLAANGATEDQIRLLYSYGSSLSSVKQESVVTISSMKSMVDVLKAVKDGTSYSSIAMLELLEQYPELSSAVIETTEGYALEEAAVKSMIAEKAKELKINESLIKSQARLNLIKGASNAKTADTVDAIFAEYGESISSFEDYIDAWEQHFGRLADGGTWAHGLEEYVNASISEAKKLKEISQLLEDLLIPDQYKFGSSDKKIESEFEKQYKHHQHLLAMEQESTEDYLNWLKEAHQAAYDENIIGLDDYYKYQEEIYDKTKGLFDDYLNDSKFAIEQLKADGASASEVSRSYGVILKAINDKIEYYTAKGFDITDDIVQKLIEEAHSLEDEIISSLDEIVSEAQSAVDDLQNVYTTLTDAADEYAEYGYITVDSLQSIIDLGVEYMAFLQDENGQLVINKENIQNVIAARTEQLAVESALNYVEQLRLALEASNAAELERLLNATNNATNATWGLVYANLALLNLGDSQYAAALNNINNLRSLADNAIANIGASMSGATQSRSDILQAELDARKEALQEQKEALDEILNYTMELIKWEAEQQVEALEEQISDYEKIVDLKKEMLETTKEEADYEDELTDKIEEIAKIQERINVLALDDSRDAQAERITMEEELADLQKDLSDYQADHMLEKHEEALDDMADAYRAEKEVEIEAVENTVSSTEKVYQLAIQRIDSDWNGLYQNLLSYNYQYGNTLQQDLVSAWGAASAAVQEYGSYVQAVSGITAAITAAENTKIEPPSGTTNLGSVGSYNAEANAYKQQQTNQVSTLVDRMRANSSAWWKASEGEREKLEADNVSIAAQIGSILGEKLVKGADGVWYLGSVGGRKLYDYYHDGGIVGAFSSVKKNETLAVLENGEMVLDDEHQKSLFRLVDFATTISDRFGKLLENVGYSPILQRVGTATAKEISAISEDKRVNIEFGDIYITGANDETVEKHREINRQFANDILKQLNIKR